jgi:predicted Zn-dependent peptidase
MKTIKNLIIAAIAILTTQVATAQTGSMKDPVSFKLKNGLTVILAENQQATKVFASLSNDNETVTGKVGAQEVLNIMLNHSAGNNELRFNEKGANIATAASNFNGVLNSLATIIQNPDLNQSTFEKAKATVIAGIYTKDRYYNSEITSQALETLTLDDVKTFYSANANAAGTYLTIAGNITLAEAKALVKKSFGDWTTITPEVLASK